jgi:hypothetical protein
MFQPVWEPPALPHTPDEFATAFLRSRAEPP